MGFKGAFPESDVRPENCDISILTENVESDATDENINEIIKGRGCKTPGVAVSGLPPGLVASHEVTWVTVDPGACDNIVPPKLFNTY